MPMSNQRTRGTIEDLVGEPLSGVAFVQDYVEFHFDGSVVRSLTMPTVTVGSALHIFPQPGSRDALCSLIGLVVEEIRVKENDEIEIVFGGEGHIRIPLKDELKNGPEAAHFVPGPNQPIAVW